MLRHFVALGSLAVAFAVAATALASPALAQEPEEERPDTTVTGTAGRTVSFTARVPNTRFKLDADYDGPNDDTVCGDGRSIVNGRCTAYGSHDHSTCRGPWALLPLSRDGVSHQGSRISVEVSEHGTAPSRDIQYVYQGVRTFRSFILDSSTNRIIRYETETQPCFVYGTARINVRAAPSQLYGYTVPADTPRTVPGVQGSFQWIVFTPTRWTGGRVSAGSYGVACSDCQVGQYNERITSGGHQHIKITPTGGGGAPPNTIRAADLPVCPTLPHGEWPDHACRKAR